MASGKLNSRERGSLFVQQDDNNGDNIPYTGVKIKKLTYEMFIILPNNIVHSKAYYYHNSYMPCKCSWPYVVREVLDFKGGLLCFVSVWYS